MRYLNESGVKRYCAMGGRVLSTGSATSEIPDLADFLDRLSSEASPGLRILLSKRDMEAIDRFIGKVGRKGVQKPVGTTNVYEQTEDLYKRRQAVIDAMMAEHRESEARINSESNFILPDGTPVPRSDTNLPESAVKGGSAVEPRIVENPSSPLDILAHNAKVSTERAQSRPLSGRAAVEARKGIPGMPNLPGIERQMENLRTEKAIADAQRAGMAPVVTSDILRSGQERNYGRK